MRSRGSDAKGLHIDAKHLAQQTSQGVTREFGDHTRAQPEDGLGQQMLEMAAGVLEFMKCPLDPFAQAIQPTIKGWGVLVTLVATLGGEDAGAGCGGDISLPVCADEALVSEQREGGQDGLRSFTFVQVGGHEFTHDGQAIQGRQTDQLVAEVFQVPAGARPRCLRNRLLRL